MQPAVHFKLFYTVKAQAIVKFIINHNCLCIVQWFLSPFIMNIFTKSKLTAFSVYVFIVLLTIIIHAYDASGCTAAIIIISTEETYGLSVRRKLPFLAHILLSIFLITRHLSQHMMYDAGFFLHARIWFDICCNLLSCTRRYDNMIILLFL